MVSKRQQQAAFERAKEAMREADEPFEAAEAASSGATDPHDDAPTDPGMALIDALTAADEQETATIMGHDVTFHALNTRDELMAARLAKPYVGSSGEGVALQTAYFALSVQLIDAHPFYVAVSGVPDDPARRFELAMNYYTPFISAWFERFSDLRRRIDERLATLSK